MPEYRRLYCIVRTVPAALPPAARAALSSSMDQRPWQHAGRTAIAAELPGAREVRSYQNPLHRLEPLQHSDMSGLDNATSRPAKAGPRDERRCRSFRTAVRAPAMIYFPHITSFGQYRHLFSSRGVEVKSPDRMPSTAVRALSMLCFRIVSNSSALLGLALGFVAG